MEHPRGVRSGVARTGVTGLIDKVRATIQKYEMTRPGDRVLVGVSGGPDSVALLHVLWVLSEELGIVLHVAHLNHMLRGEAADEDAAYVSDLAGRLGLPVTVESRDVAAIAREERVSLELAAREARYEFYREVARSTGATRVALGHHAGDQAETVLLRLLRGTGTTGLGGIPPVRPLGTGEAGAGNSKDKEGPVIIRPLIGVPRREIEAYCVDNHLSPRVDASNLAPVYARNRVRHELIPLLERRFNPRIVESIARTAELVREDDAFISGEVRRRMGHIIIGKSPGGALLSVTRLLAEPVAVQRRVVREAIALLGLGVEDVGFEHVETVLELAREGSPGAAASLPRGIWARKAYRPAKPLEGGDRQGVSLAIGSPVELILEFGSGPAPVPEPERWPSGETEAWAASESAARSHPGGPLAARGFEHTLNVPGTTFVPELGLIIDAEVFETKRCGRGEDARVGRVGHVGRAGAGPCPEPDPYEAFFDLDALGPSLAVRTRREGDRIRPFGMEGHKKLKDLFIDDKIPRNIRDRVPVIVAGKDILWVVGVKRSDLARVSPSTRRVLRLAVRAAEHGGPG